MRKKIIAGFFLVLSFSFTALSYSEENNSLKNKVQSSNNIKLDINYLNKKNLDFYIIGSGDYMAVTIADDYPELITKARVSGEGTIILPSLGTQYVKDLTINELENLLNESYKKYVRYPSVKIKMLSYRPVKVFIDGEVNNPGFYTLRGSRVLVDEFSPIQGLEESPPFSNLTDNTLDGFSEAVSDDQENVGNLTFFFPTLFDALKESGGITRYSDLSNIKVVRKNSISKGGGKIETILNFEDILIKVDNSQNIRIKDGDMIFVKKLPNNRKNLINDAIKSNLNPKFIKVFVSGRVNSPGVLTLGKLSVLNDAIEMAGGTKILRGKLNYLSLNNKGNLSSRIIKYRKKNKRGSKNNPYLNNGDLIYIGNNILSSTSEVISEVTAPFQGLYSAYRLFELIGE